MSVSNNRFQEPDSVHHLVSRIAHRVLFMKEDECNDFVAMMRRVAEFGGIRLLGWCILTNHFHILVYLPPREDVDDEEVVRRVKVLKGVLGGQAFENELARLRAQGDEGEAQAELLLNRMRERMYDLAEFMKILKQWFTQDYNSRNSHVGTLWESAYHDKIVPMKVSDMAQVLAYIHLNPIRAAITPDYKAYRWSSLTAAANGDHIAMEGLKFVYDAPDEPIDGLIDSQMALMDQLLEGLKRKRAEDIARKRLAGYDVPADELTNEAYIAKAKAQLEKVLSAGVEIKESAKHYSRSENKRIDLQKRIILSIQANPSIGTETLVKEIGKSRASVYRAISQLTEQGVLKRDGKFSPWSVNVSISGLTIN